MTMTDTEAAIEQLDPDSTPIAPNVYEAIRRVTRDIGRIAKTGRGPATQGSYPFMPIDDIVGGLQPLFAEHGLVCVPSVLKQRVEIDEAERFNQDGTPARDGRNNNLRTRVRMKIAYRFVSVADQSELVAVVVGEAHDSADKALNKAETAAYKKALTRVFSIAPGETDPDTTNGAEQDEAAAPAPGARRSRREQSIDKSRGTARTPALPAPDPSDPKDVPTQAEIRPRPARGPAAPIEQHDAHEPDTKDDAALEQQAAAAREQYLAEAAGPQTVTEAVVEQQEATWKPDPADIAHAERTAPAAAPTQVEQRAEDIAAIKSELRRAWSARGLTREQANAIGDKVTGKPRTEWMLRKDSLAQVLKAIQNGEVAE